MNILVTGAGGMLGKEIKSLTTNDTNNTYYFTYHNDLDICDEQLVNDFISTHNINVVINCAAYTNVDAAEDNIQLAEQINVKGTRILARACKQYNATLIHISTDYVFDGTNCRPYDEDDECCPISVYGKTKADGEIAIIYSECNYIILRTAWLHSEYNKNFVKNIINAAKTKNELLVTFDQVGTPTWSHDLANAIIHIINTNQLNKKGIYNFTNEGVCSWFDFAYAVKRYAGLNISIKPIHSYEYHAKAKRPHYSVLDKTKFTQTFNYDIPFWDNSLIKCIANIKMHENLDLSV